MSASRQGGVEKRFSESALSRDDLITALGRVMDAGFKKLDGRYTTNPEKVQWSRIIVQAASAAGSILRDVELNELALRVEELESEADRVEGDKDGHCPAT